MSLADDWTTGTVRANGVDLAWYRTGEGPPIVLVHGFYDDGRRWVPLTEDLAADYEVVAYDARGHGRSDAPESGYGIDDRIADLLGVIEGLDLADPILMGHSMGAGTVAWTAARHPDCPRAVVLEDPVGVHDEPEMSPEERATAVRERLATVADLSVEAVIDEHYPEADPGRARRLATASKAADPAIAEIGREGYPAPLGETFSEIGCPTLVLRSDAAVERRVADLNAAEDLADGRLVHVPDAGHYVLGDEYEAARAELAAFLRRL